MKNNSKADPTNQGRNRASANQYIGRVEDNLYGSVEQWVNSVPYEDGKYLLPQDAQPNRDFENALLAALLINGTFFLDPNVEGAFRSGVLGAERDLEASITGFQRSGDTNRIYNFDSTFSSPEYQRSLSSYQQSAQDSINASAIEASARISTIILLGMNAGKPVDELLTDIKRQTEIMASKMERTSTTTINQGLSQGGMIAGGLAATALGLTAVVQHISALIPTTRPHHAARHHKFYKIQDQNIWWATGANSINCYCRAKPVLIK